MKKILILLSAVLWFYCMLPNPAGARNIELNVREFKCLEDGKIIIFFSVINTRDFDHPNVSLCFKISRDGNPITCRELRVVIPKRADGSRIYKTFVDVACGQGSYGLSSTVFHNAKRYQIEEWFRGCPGSWESKGHEVLE